jgi:hypothetical protein
VETTRVSASAKATFGSLAEQLPPIISEAMNTAHELALKAHLSGEMDRHDTYGHTLKVKMHEVLADAVRHVPGVIMRKPAGGRFPLPVIQETAVALLPLRYSTDRKETRESAKINLSELRRSLLALVTPSATKNQQLSIEDAMADDCDMDMDAHFQEMADIDEQLAAFGRVVTIGFGSNPSSGLWGLGWGDLRLAETGHKTTWESWNDLPLASPGGLDLGRTTGLHSVGTVQPVYFDQTDEADELDLSPRDPRTQSDEESPSTQASGNSAL